ENDQHRRRQDDPQRSAGPQEVFVFAGIFDRHAGRQRGDDRPIDPLLDLVDETAQVAVLHIGLDEDAQPAVLARDFTRAGVATNRCELSEGDELAGRRGDQHLAKALDVVAFAALQADLNGKTLPALDRRGYILAAEAGFHDAEQILSAESVPRHGLAVHFNLEI